MFDTVGPELTITNATGSPISLTGGEAITLTPDQSAVISDKLLPHNYPNLAKVTIDTNAIPP